MRLDKTRYSILQRIEIFEFRLYQYKEKMIDKYVDDVAKEQFKNLIKTTEEHIVELKQDLKR